MNDRNFHLLTLTLPKSTTAEHKLHVHPYRTELDTMARHALITSLDTPFFSKYKMRCCNVHKTQCQAQNPRTWHTRRSNAAL